MNHIHQRFFPGIWKWQAKMFSRFITLSQFALCPYTRSSFFFVWCLWVVGTFLPWKGSPIVDVELAASTLTDDKGNHTRYGTYCGDRQSHR